MKKQTLCFLVLGASLGVLLQNLANRRYVPTARPAPRKGSADVIDLAAWKEMKSRNELALSAK